VSGLLVTGGTTRAGGRPSLSLPISPSLHWRRATAIPLAVPVAAKIHATAALLWDGRKRMNELVGAGLVSLYFWLIPNPSAYVYYSLIHWPLLPLAPTAAAAYAFARRAAQKVT